jgi:hypothetical protein
MSQLVVAFMTVAVCPSPVILSIVSSNGKNRVVSPSVPW